MNKIKIIIAGETQVGKTSLLNQYIPNFPDDEISQTYITDKYNKEIIIEGTKLYLEIWDFAGGKRYREVNKIYLQSSKIVLLVYDKTNINSFNELKYHYQIICEFNEKKNILFGILANKSDLYEDKVTRKKGEEYAKSINALFFETTTIDYECVQNVFEEMLKLFYIITFNKTKIERIIREKNNNYLIYLIESGIQNFSELYYDTEEGYINYENGNIYVGQLNQKKRNGYGIILYLNKNEYEGEWKNDKKEGNGIMKYNNGEIYNGKWKDDIFINGKIEFNNGEIYDGDWNNNKREGYGKMTYKNGDIYEGNYINNKREINGKMTYNNKDIYDGDWNNDKREGHGKMTYNNGDIYDGDWNNDKREGHGKMTYKNGDIYEGDWKNNEKNGKGKIYYKDNKILEGFFVDGIKNGEMKITIKNIGYLQINFIYDIMNEKGIFYYENGDKLDGYFNKNYNPIHGKLIYKNGEIYEGKLDENNKRKGKGIMRYNNGEIYDGDWNNDMKEGEGILYLNNDDYTIIKDIIFDNNDLDNLFNLNLKYSFYKGSFKKNLKNGEGILYMNNKNIFLNGDLFFKGIFKNNYKYNGTLYFKNKSYLNCYWKDENNIDETLSGTFVINDSIKFIKKLNTNKWINLIKKEQLNYFGNTNINIPVKNIIK